MKFTRANERMYQGFLEEEDRKNIGVIFDILGINGDDSRFDKKFNEITIDRILAKYVTKEILSAGLQPNESIISITVNVTLEDRTVLIGVTSMNGYVYESIHHN
jgi:hypothetical protein